MNKIKNWFKKTNKITLVVIFIVMITSVILIFFAQKQIDCEVVPSIVSGNMGITLEEYWTNYRKFIESSDGICDFKNGANRFNDADCGEMISFKSRLCEEYYKSQ